MKRPLFVIGICYALTTWVAFLRQFDLRHAMLLSGALCATGVLFLVIGRRGLRLPCLLLLSAALALGGYGMYQLRQVAPYQNLVGQTVEIQGLITGEWVTNRGSFGHELDVQFLSRDELSPYQGMVVYAYGDTLGSPGDTVRCLVKFYAAGQNLSGTLQGIPHTVEPDGFSLQRSLVLLRAGMWRNVRRNLPPEAAAITGAVVLGLTDDIGSDLYHDLNRSGTSHLLAVSGLHLSIITNLILMAARRKLLPPWLGYLLAVLGGFLFAGLTGFRPSMMRAFLMLSVMVLGQLLSRDNDPLTALGSALLVICVLRPHWVLTKSLWLSATATLGLLLYADELIAKFYSWIPTGSGPVFRRISQLLLGAAALSLSSYVFAAPVLFVVSGWVSLLSPLANMLVAPFVPVLLISGFFCAGGFLPASLLAVAVRVCSFCSSMVLGVSRLFSRLPFCIFSLDAFYLLLLVAGFCAGLLVLHWYGWDRKLVAYGLAALLLCYSAGTLSYQIAGRDTVELVELEGINLTLLLRGDEAVVLGYIHQGNAGGLRRYLDFRGVRHVSLVVVADFPEQLNSGILEIEARYGIGCMLVQDDGYVISMLQAALPQTAVLSSAGAVATALDGVVIRPDFADGVVALQVGGTFVLKSGEKYAIIAGYEQGVQLFADGMYLPGGLHPQVEPLGAHLFGETRVLLDTGGTVPVLQG